VVRRGEVGCCSDLGGEDATHASMMFEVGVEGEGGWQAGALLPAINPYLSIKL
jgi:hypothetical protein